jgi:hypothetical protein
MIQSYDGAVSQGVSAVSRKYSCHQLIPFALAISVLAALPPEIVSVGAMAGDHDLDLAEVHFLHVADQEDLAGDLAEGQAAAGVWRQAGRQVCHPA